MRVKKIMITFTCTSNLFTQRYYQSFLVICMKLENQNSMNNFQFGRCTLFSIFKIIEIYQDLACYSSMSTYTKNINATVETKEASSFKIYKSKRNNSLPDLPSIAIQSHSPSKYKLKYNKWYIKPDLRLKTSINQQLELSQTPDRFTNYYQSLYQAPLNFQNNFLLKKSKKHVKMNVAEQLCADLQNIRLLSNFKSKKQSVKKRIPGVIDFLLKYKQKENHTQLKKSYLRRKKLV